MDRDTVQAKLDNLVEAKNNTKLVELYLNDLNLFEKKYNKNKLFQKSLVFNNKIWEVSINGCRRSKKGY
mgnify:CR=1 FL=1